MCREGRIIHSDEAENDARKDSFPTEYLNNAEKVLKLRIDTTASTEELQRQIEEVVSVLCPFMIRDAKNTPLQIKPLTGGLSNHLFLVSAAGTSLVLVRIHPDADQQQTCDDNNDPEDSFSIVDRDFETKFAAWLATQQEDLPHNRSTMAPAMYGRFENGRIEEFYPNVRPLACPEMKTYAPWIAQSMASFHSLGHPPEDILQAPPTSVGGTRNSTIYQTIRAWLNEASRAQLDEATNEFLKELSKEWDWLENILAEPPKEDSLKGDNNSKNPIVAEALEFVRRMAITHMDCQPLNILIGDNGAEDKKEGMVQDLDTLRLIDFEYSGWNPIAADIANTFCEYCEMSNLCADYDNEYPTPVQQDDFFWHYLLQSNPARAKEFPSYSRRQGDKENIHGAMDGCDEEWELFSATLQKEVGRFSLLSHLGWAIWSIIKAQEEEGIDFDYMVYARHRMEGYAWAKEKFCVEI